METAQMGKMKIKSTESTSWEMGVQGRLGAYLNTMVDDLRIDYRGQYLRKHFGKYEKELKAFIAQELEKARQEEREKIRKQVRELRYGELGLCPDDNPDGKHFFPCWHQNLRFEALDQIMEYLDSEYSNSTASQEEDD